MRSANFRYLFNFLNNEGHSLILSKLVVEESENIRERNLAASIIELNKVMRASCATEQTFDRKKLGIEIYELAPLIKARTECVEEIDYEHIAQSEVVKRALSVKRPFSNGEKGYRDTLIWLSFIDFLATKKVTEDVAFISENTTDFFAKKGKGIAFHPDLVSDIEQKNLKCKIIPYASLFAFAQTTIDKSQHEFDHGMFEEEINDSIEELSSAYIENLTNSELANLLGASVFSTHIGSIKEIHTDVFEGIEDPCIVRTERIKDEVYVSYSYNLRRVILEIDISEIEYLINKTDLDQTFYSVDVSGDTASLSVTVRPYFEVSFLFDEETASLSNFDVENVWFQQ